MNSMKREAMPPGIAQEATVLHELVFLGYFFFVFLTASLMQHACNGAALPPFFLFGLYACLYAYPVGFLAARLALPKAGQGVGPFFVATKMLLGLTLIGFVNYVAGLSLAVNGLFGALSLLVLARDCRKALRCKPPLAALAQPLVAPGFVLFAAATVVAFILAHHYVVIQGQKIFNFDSDVSVYVALTSAFAQHKGSFFFGFVSPLTPVEGKLVLRYLSSLFEALFDKFSGFDILFVHTTVFPQLLVTMFLACVFVPPFCNCRESCRETAWNWDCLAGLTLLVPVVVFGVFTLFVTATHNAVAVMALLFVAILLIRAGREHPSDWPWALRHGLLLCLAAVANHGVISFFFVCALLVFLVESRGPGRGWLRRLRLGVWVLGAVLLAVGFKVTLGSVSLTPSALEANMHLMGDYGAQVRQCLAAAGLDGIFGVRLRSNIIALVGVAGWLLPSTILYFLNRRSLFRTVYLDIMFLQFFFLNCLLFTTPVNFSGNYPGMYGMYFPISFSLVLLGIFYEQLLALMRASARFLTVRLRLVWAVSAGVFLISCLVMRYPLFADHEFTYVPADLVAMLAYIRGHTPVDALVMHNLNEGLDAVKPTVNASRVAYVGGLGLRHALAERWIDFQSERAVTLMKDIAAFCAGDDPDLTAAIAEKYKIDYVLESPQCAVALPEGRFSAVHSEGPYTLYRFHDGK